MPPDDTRKCSKCGRDTRQNEFAPKRNWCRQCVADYQKLYYQRNRETLAVAARMYNVGHKIGIAKQRKEYSVAHKGEIAATTRKWYEANRAKTIERAKIHVSSHKAERAEYAKQWASENQAKLVGYRHSHYEANKETHQAKSKEWIANNPDAAKAIRLRNKAKRKGAVGSFSAAEWRAVKERFQNRCVCCGRVADKDDPASKLTVDHVVPLVRGGTNFIGNIQPLCGHCNSSKSAHRSTDYRSHPFAGVAQLALRA